MVPVPVATGVGSAPAFSSEFRCIEGLTKAFASLRDPRDRRGRRHPLGAILNLVLVGLLRGCENASQIYHFGRMNPPLLAGLGFGASKRPRVAGRQGVIYCPNEDTISSVLGRIAPRALNKALGRWLGAMLADDVVASVDGKALRGSGNYVLSLFVHSIGHVIWQEDIGSKQNELSVLKRHLPHILAQFPQLSLLTGDAAFGHKIIAQQVIEARRNYFLQLKSPHETDVGIARDAFSQITRSRKAEASTVDKRGGRRGGNW
jgi:DDE_Tnp_1-associated